MIFWPYSTKLMNGFVNVLTKDDIQIVDSGKIVFHSFLVAGCFDGYVMA